MKTITSSNSDVVERVLNQQIVEALKQHKNFKIVDLPVITVKSSELVMCKGVYNDLNDFINKHKNDYVLVYETRWIPVGDTEDWENIEDMPQKLYVRFYVPSDKKIWKTVEGSNKFFRKIKQKIKELLYLREWDEFHVH